MENQRAELIDLLIKLGEEIPRKAKSFVAGLSDNEVSRLLGLKRNSYEKYLLEQ